MKNSKELEVWSKSDKDSVSKTFPTSAASDTGVK